LERVHAQLPNWPVTGKDRILHGAGETGSVRGGGRGNSREVDPNIPQLTVPIYRAVLEELRSRNLVFEVDAGGAPVRGIALHALEVTTDVRQLRCDRCSLMLSVGPEAAQRMAAGPYPHGACKTGTLREQPRAEDYYGRLYQAGDVARIFAEEDTGLLTREVRDAVEIGFQKRGKPGDPNLLSCTPTQSGICSWSPVVAKPLSAFDGSANGNRIRFAPSWAVRTSRNWHILNKTAPV